MRKDFLHHFCSFFSLILAHLLHETLGKAQVGAARTPASLQRGMDMGFQVRRTWASKRGGHGLSSEVDMGFQVQWTRASKHSGHGLSSGAAPGGAAEM